MSITKTLIHSVTLCLFCCILPAAAYEGGALPLDKIKLPSGFSIHVWAEAPNSRGLTLGKNGTVFAGSKEEGKV
ncbi:MAG: sorbosone dehydrogenase family protein, partial [Pseudomonadota bacterium]|nr:sorbosone dehydrogenase family protein [Pseudomonadota bacterium]